MLTKYATILLIFTLIGCSHRIRTDSPSTVSNYYTQGQSNRTAAEWEPAIGTMLTWPLCVPYKLAVELAKDNHLFTLVANDSSKMEAVKWYTKWGITDKQNTFVMAPQGIDAWWTRDWGPSAIFTPDGKMKLGDGKYIFATPSTTLGCNDSLQFLYFGQNHEITRTEVDDNATVPLAKALQMEVLDLPYITTGGNVMTDGLGTAFSSCILLNENKFYQVSGEKFFELNKKLSGFERYVILSNFEQRGIQHIDCLMKLLDEERILVAEPPQDHELYPIYENIVQNELAKLKTAYGRPYEILRLKTDRYFKDKLAAYTNSIIVNKTIYVPLFQIKQDQLALETWRKAMPGYTVKGFEFALKDEPVVSTEMQTHYASGYGWNHGDALHCRTRAVWDSQMLYLTTKKIAAVVQGNQTHRVYTTIIDYSKSGLVRESCKLFWKVSGEKSWKSVELTSTKNPEHFYADIPNYPPGTSIEYYVAATSRSGRMETQPRTAPAGVFQFSIK
jgi:agmatine deiminase